MVVIRLSRGGAKKRPFYYIVVADKHRSRDGRFIEQIGYYNPVSAGQDLRVNLDMERANHWIAQGAQPSDRVKHLIKLQQKMALETNPSA